MNSILLDTCVITGPPATEPVLDRVTGQMVSGPRVEVWRGCCRIQVKADINSNVVESTAGDREGTYLTSTLQVPVECVELARHDMVAEILTAAHDQSLVGRLFNIQGIYHKSDATHRRYRVREVIA